MCHRIRPSITHAAIPQCSLCPVQYIECTCCSLWPTPLVLTCRRECSSTTNLMYHVATCATHATSHAFRLPICLHVARRATTCAYVRPHHYALLTLTHCAFAHLSPHHTRRAANRRQWEEREQGKDKEICGRERGSWGLIKGPHEEIVGCVCTLITRGVFLLTW
jgi:hypothetical protein